MKSYVEFAILSVILVIQYAVAIKIFSRCPSTALRGLIANKTCPRAPKHYHCLETLQSKDFLQICIRPERIEEGEYPVFQDSTAKYIFPKTCVSSRYQPRPMFTYERHECWYEKSSCMEEGQIIFNNGSATDDRTCRCDYTKGYAFISTPINTCYCVPSKEDCSCYKKECLIKKEVLNADYMCSTVKDNETCPVIVRTEYPDIPEKKINNTDINTVLFSNHRRIVAKLVGSIIMITCLPFIMFLIIFNCYKHFWTKQKIAHKTELEIIEELKNIQFKESSPVLFECTVSKKKSRATWLKDGKQIRTSDVSCKRYIFQSEGNIHSLKIEKASLQDIGTYTVIIENKLSCGMLSIEDDGEHLSAVKKVIMGNTKPLPNEQQDKDIYDAVIVCETDDNEEAEEFVRHIHELDKEWQLDIKIELSCIILQKGGKISTYEKLFDITRFIFIFCTEKSSSKGTERFKNETLLVKSLLDSDKFYRVIPVSVDGPKCIPFEFIALIPISYYSFKQRKQKGQEDKVYIRMLQTLFQLGRTEHLSI